MSKTVILAEKPSQASAYAEAFSKSDRKSGYYTVSGNNYNNAVITYGFGHLVSLYNPDEYDDSLKKWKLNTLPIFPKPFKFKVEKDKQKQYNIVKKHLDEADEIIIATDGDREGEAIARLIINLSGNSHKKLKRLWINSLETEEIKKGFNNLKNGEDYYSSFKEAETRQKADWLVGMNLSRLYTLYMQKNGMKGAFSVGRVQTPTLYLIYQRNKEIDEFVSKPFYELYANFTHEKGNYQGKYASRFDDLNELEEFKENNNLDKGKAIVKEVETIEKKQFAPKLYSLSDLQTEANKKYGYDVSETLNIADDLYGKKILSYPRTDSNYIGSPEFNYIKENLSKYLNLADEEIVEQQLEENKRYVNGKKVKEHYAIIPTRTIPDLNELSKEEKNIYELVLYRTLAIFEKPYIYDETTIITNINEVAFETKEKVEKQIGWKRLVESNQKTETDLLPEVLVDDLVGSELKVTQGKTTPPDYYTEGTLVKAMKNVGRTLDDEENKDILRETEGIGTEATRAHVIETLKIQKYISIKSKKIYVTKKGVTLCEVIKNNEISNAELTADWEKYLKRIREGTGTQEAFLASIERFINHLIETVPENFENSDIDKHVKEIEAKNIIAPCTSCEGNLVDKGKFYGCTSYPDCKFTLSKKFRNRKLTKTNIKELLDKKETVITKIKSKNGNEYSAKVKLNDKDYIDFIEFAK